MSRMRILNLAGFVVAAAVAILVVTPTPNGAEGDAKGDPIREGERLVHALDCGICHSPKVFTDRGPMPDESRLLSGHPAELAIPVVPVESLGPNAWGGLFNPHMTAWAGPWGVSFGINLTPDDETGIGVWTEEIFRNALRTGKHMGAGRPILPPMPWQAYAALTDEEIHDIFAYLKSLPPVKNPVPAPMPPGGPGD